VTEAESIIRDALPTRWKREPILKRGYPGYDTSIGWFNYSDEEVKENVRKSVARGFCAMKLKVGDPDMDKDLRRATIVREGAGPDARVMVDCNQQWCLPHAFEFGERADQLGLNLYWIEEPTHPDDILGHARLARAYGRTLLAAGEHLPNRIIFKNYLQAGALGICQVDAVRVAGVSEFMAISLMARKSGIPVVPHVGDMGQIHQHLVLFNHIGLSHETLMLEHIPHLQDRFTHPARVHNGAYEIPQEPGMSSDFIHSQ
jgi:L-fuconate dehydratase